MPAPPVRQPNPQFANSRYQRPVSDSSKARKEPTFQLLEDRIHIPKTRTDSSSSSSRSSAPTATNSAAPAAALHSHMDYALGLLPDDVQLSAFLKMPSLISAWLTQVRLSKGEGDARLLEELIDMLVKNPGVAAMAEKSQEELRNKAQRGSAAAAAMSPPPAATQSPSSAASSATSAIRAEDLEALMMNEAAAASSRRASRVTPVPETLTKNAVLDEILGSEGGEWSDMLEQTPEEEDDDERMTRDRLLRLYQLGTTAQEATATASARQASPPPPPLPTFQSRFSSERGERRSQEFSGGPMIIVSALYE